MAIKIRLSRGGNKNRPIYNVVVAEARSPRDGRFLEKLGMYDPKADPKHVIIKLDRLEHWLKMGAKPSERVRRVLNNGCSSTTSSKPNAGAVLG